jgi:hypothetical protein
MTMKTNLLPPNLLPPSLLPTSPLACSGPTFYRTHLVLAHLPLLSSSISILTTITHLPPMHFASPSYATPTYPPSLPSWIASLPLLGLHGFLVSSTTAPPTCKFGVLLPP